MVELLNACNLTALMLCEDASVDAVVTDPPYGLSFMGKKWDYDVPTVDLWREVFRVLKPGGHLLSFGGTRTYHRMVVAIEDAGFDVRDQIMWIYGSGFPKSMNVAIAIGKQAGAMKARGQKFNTAGQDSRLNQNKELRSDHPDYVVPGAITPDAKRWQGYGTALKPANEPIVLARKPLEKGLTVAQNVQRWGTGALNIDGTRIASGADHAANCNRKADAAKLTGNGRTMGKMVRVDVSAHVQGRWPANVLFDECAAEMLDEQSGVLKSGSLAPGRNDSGGASRFFYVAKASKRERNANHHPTVKPIKLMEYLITLVCPPGGIVLDPFMGSGTTGVAAKNLKRKFMGFEIDEDYFKIASKRIGR